MSGVSPRLEELRKHLWANYNQLLQQEETYWYHMARHKWVSLGDKNTRFFHQAALTRRRRNRVMALKNDADVWVYEDRALRHLVSNFYSGLFTTSGISHISYSTCSSFPVIDVQDLAALG